MALAAGRTLTIRLYFRVASNTEGRYFVLRNVVLKSTQAVLATRARTLTNLAAHPNPVQNHVLVPHTAASRHAQVSVFGATSARVATFAAVPGTLETAVDLSALAQGLS